MTIRQTVVQRAEQTSGHGWHTEQLETQVGTIYLDQVFYGIADQSVPGQLLGLGEQLQPLADYLNENTDLASRPWPIGPGGEGAEGILRHFLVRLSHQYLQALPDLGKDDPSLIERLTAELEHVVRQDAIYRRWQLAIGGLMVDQPYKHRGVLLRPLTPLKRGALAEPELASRTNREIPGSEFVLPSSFSITLPSALLELTIKRRPTQQFDASNLPNAIVLAFFLSGFEISGTGVITNFDYPRWATPGTAPASLWCMTECV